MKPPIVDYRRARTIEEALALLGEFGDEAKVMSGGQSLVPLLKMRLSTPAVLVDVGKVPELRREPWYVDDGRSWVVPAALTHARFEDGLGTGGVARFMATVAAGIGYRAVRNRGTLGGSMAHADASAEWPVVLSALDAELVVRSPRGARRLSARGFVVAPFMHDLEPDELITEVVVPELPERTRTAAVKLCRKPGEFSESLAVGVLGIDGAGVVTTADVWLGAAGPTPLELSHLRDYLRGRRLRDLDLDLTALEAVPDIEAAGRDVDTYEGRMHQHTVARALRDLCGRTAA